MQHFIENPLIERPRLEPMYNYAKKKHDDTGAIRKHSGNPYWEHPEGVADIALAHDTLEDTDATFDEIAEQFGSEIANYVQEITNNKDEVKRLGKEEYINQELENLSHPALFVKLCDILYNCLDYPSDSQLARMSKNIDHLISHRKDLTDREWELIEAIPVV